MTGRYVRLFMLVLLLLAVASPSFAARRSSLSGNLLIQDQDDIFFFPHLVSMHNRMVTFDFGPSSTTNWLGSGGMAFGDERFTIGLFAHRSDFLGALQSAYNTRGDIDNVGFDGEIDVPPGVGPNALNWIDVLAGFEAWGNPWGVRFSVGRNNDDPNAADIASDVSAFNVIVGTRLQQWGATDVSVEFSWASESDQVAAGTTDASPVHFAVGIRHTAADESDALFFGWLGEIAYTSGSADFTPVPAGPGTSGDFSNLNLVLGAGPVYKPNDRTNVAMYGTFEYNQDETDDATVKDTHTESVIPGWNVAAEVEIASWLQFRSGLRSKFVFFTEEHDFADVNTPDTQDKNNRLDFDWSTGIGVRWGNFTFDGYFDPAVITTGTDLLGNASQLFGLVTTTLHF
jgi:hypothetical protein